MDDINNIDWIDEMHNEEKKYTKFYKKPITKISIRFFYPDDESKKIVYKLKSPSYITSSELLSLIQNEKNLDKREYSIHEIFKYNSDIDNDDINDYIESPMSATIEYCKFIDSFNAPKRTRISNKGEFRFFTKEKKEEDIFFNDTIAMFETLNTLFIFFKCKDENKSKKQKHTREETKTRKIKPCKIKPCKIKPVK